MPTVNKGLMASVVRCINLPKDVKSQAYCLTVSLILACRFILRAKTKR